MTTRKGLAKGRSVERKQQDTTVPGWLTASGVGRVVIFNWPKYASAGLALGVLIAMSASSRFDTGIIGWFVVLGAIALVCGIAGSLLSTWWVYDYRAPDLYKTVASKHAPGDGWIMVHAGLDESHGRLDAIIGSTQHNIDVGPTSNLSASLKRAHRWVGRSGKSWEGALDIKTDSVGLAVVLFGIHELSRPVASKLLAELRRVVRSGGEIVIVEHLRDLPNFLAFGPGMLHFGTRRRWRAAIEAAGLPSPSERRVAGLVTVFSVSLEATQ